MRLKFSAVTGLVCCGHLLSLAHTPATRATGEVSAQKFFPTLVAAAWERTRQQVTYDPAYRKLAYPMGDPPADRGVCSDVVIRAYRHVGIDLQKSVHEDMRRTFTA